MYLMYSALVSIQHGYLISNLFAYYVDCISDTGMVFSNKKKTRNFVVDVIVVVG